MQELNVLSDSCDLLILQTRFLEKDTVMKIANKTLIAGYVSVLEFDGDKEDFKKYNLSAAAIGKNENWDSIIMNINNKNYQKYLLSQIQSVFDSGAQGVFLDTADDIDDYPQLTDGTVHFIKMLHEKYPDKFFIMNRGFTIIDRVVDSIQGVLFEDLGTYYNFDKKCYTTFNKEEMDWIAHTAEKLKKYQDEGKLRVIASGYAPSPFSPLTLYGKLLADKYGFAFYCSDLDITDVWFNFVYPMPIGTHIFAE
jgi:hypothetical protein